MENQHTFHLVERELQLALPNGAVGATSPKPWFPPESVGLSDQKLRRMLSNTDVV